MRACVNYSYETCAYAALVRVCMTHSSWCVCPTRASGYGKVALVGLISSFINSRNHSSKASLKPIISREWRTEERDVKDISGCFYAILPCKIAADGEAIMSLVLRSSVRHPQFSSLENPPSLCTTKGLAPFGIPILSYILIF